MTQPALRYIPQLDGLRALAVAAVVALHLNLPHSDGGFIGVDVFFVLSGYLITWVLLAELDNCELSLGRFYARRMLRLYPALIVMVVLLTPVGASLVPSDTTRAYLASAAAAATYTSDFISAFDGAYMGAIGHTWSLAIEEQFYLLWPLALIGLLVHRGASRAAVAKIAAAAAAAAMVALVLLYGPGNNGAPGAAYYLPMTRGGVLLFGCALALTKRPLRRGGQVTLVGLLVLAAVVVAPVASDTRTGGLMIVLAAAASTLVIAGLVSAPGSWAARALSTPAMTFGGRLSYSIYLWHLPIVWGISSHPFGLSASITIVLKLAATLAVSYASYRLVEMPFLRLKDRLRPRPDSAIPTGV
jgi:peptidoglycan/LPS O-acetylase OafA/YrhL